MQEETVQPGLGPSTVGQVPEHRRPDGGEMGADLMEHAGEDLDLEQRRVAGPPQDPKTGERLPAASIQRRLDVVSAVAQRQLDLP